MRPANEVDCTQAIDDVLQIFGGKWPFLVVQQLFKGPQRFNQLRRNLDTVSSKALSEVLRNLEQNDIVLRTVYPTNPVSVEYSLTNKGQDFQSTLVEMGMWRKRWAQ
ncbi:transcriptional regulator, HxlR family [Cohnella sp. OV330]|uniref:winged helix-turn-helix transcriptional regulator n=1 Tax=Cohnella sp. OV330 TaxID=1855288 RepID=UPI0008F3056C|nr:helix-turn-helix domain-containing protein [Cohnella sp. OV330]SFB58203.1 transcriptional regulator, HxlR family [Cohnella sp. OV330]